MTASTIIRPITDRRPLSGIAARFAGLRPLARKELGEWRHSRRVWVIPLVITLFMVLTAANAWITTTIATSLPPDVQAPAAPASMAPLDNLLAAVSTQVFILAAIFAAMNLLIGERERGTLAWVASQPVERGAIWSAKWLVGSAAIALVAAVIPAVATTAVVVALYGIPDAVTVVALLAGMAAVVVFYVAVVLAASTVVMNQAAVAAIGFAMFVVPVILSAVVPFDIGPFLPTSILTWAVGLAMGAPVGIVTPIAWVVGTAALVAVATRQMGRLEL